MVYASTQIFIISLCWERLKCFLLAILKYSILWHYFTLGPSLNKMSCECGALLYLKKIEQSYLLVWLPYVLHLSLPYFVISLLHLTASWQLCLNDTEATNLYCPKINSGFPTCPKPVFSCRSHCPSQLPKPQSLPSFQPNFRSYAPMFPITDSVFSLLSCVVSIWTLDCPFE